MCHLRFFLTIKVHICVYSFDKPFWFSQRICKFLDFFLIYSTAVLLLSRHRNTIFFCSYESQYVKFFYNINQIKINYRYIIIIKHFFSLAGLLCDVKLNVRNVKIPLCFYKKITYFRQRARRFLHTEQYQRQPFHIFMPCLPQL